VDGVDQVTLVSMAEQKNIKTRQQLNLQDTLLRLGLHII
jgi:hypothetical protein